MRFWWNRRFPLANVVVFVILCLAAHLLSPYIAIAGIFGVHVPIGCAAVNANTMDRLKLFSLRYTSPSTSHVLPPRDP